MQISPAITLPSTTAARVADLVRMLGSDKSGEVVAAATMLKRTLARVDADIHDLATAAEQGLRQAARPPVQPPMRPRGGWRSDLALCKARSAFLTARERAFITSITWQREPTKSQQVRLRDIADRQRGGSR